ncbi:MAG TPA: cation:proton antiporter, partial [Amycolatopsis sp.]|nr:cation:proton antiporter [Amycolatopsis sp.]
MASLESGGISRPREGTIATEDSARPRGRVFALYAGLAVASAAIVAVLFSGSGTRGAVRSIAADAHPFARFFLAVAVVVGTCKLAGALVRRLGQPPVIGEIAAGILLGPSVFGAVWPAGRSWLVPDQVLGQLNVLAQLGVVLFVFLTGLELDPKRLRGRGQLAAAVGQVSIVAPFLLGVLLAVAGYRHLAPAGVGYLPFALFLGVSMSVTALPVLARILLDLDLYRSRIGVLVMTCALVADVAAWILLGLVIAVASAASLSGVLVTIAGTAVFAGLLLALRPLLVRRIEAVRPERTWMAAQLILVGVLVSATITEWIGVRALFGAFLFGLVLPADNAVAQRVHGIVGNLTTALLLPLFFAYSGLRTNLTLLGANAGLWLWCVLIVVVAVVGKFGGSALAARAVGAGWREACRIGALMNCRGLTELVVLNVGLDLGVLSPALFAMFVLMALISTA